MKMQRQPSWYQIIRIDILSKEGFSHSILMTNKIDNPSYDKRLLANSPMVNSPRENQV